MPFLGSEAIEILKSNDPPEVMYIFSDINMPGMSGIELLRKVKAEFPAIKVSMMYTDGVTEAIAQNGVMYEEPRLEKFLANHAEDDLKKLVRGLVVDILKFMGKADQSDDITILSVEFTNS